MLIHDLLDNNILDDEDEEMAAGAQAADEAVECEVAGVEAEVPWLNDLEINCWYAEQSREGTDCSESAVVVEEHLIGTPRDDETPCSQVPLGKRLRGKQPQPKLHLRGTPCGLPILVEDEPAPRVVDLDNSEESDDLSKKERKKLRKEQRRGVKPMNGKKHK